METRSKVAAATAALVPFHCVICFEEFCSTDRPPMVLPCGHTFVCLPCSKRLKKCMECREPLFIPAAQQQPSKMFPPLNGSSRQAPPMYSRPGRHSPSPSTPQTPPQMYTIQSTTPAPIPLPIPKNLVLLAMMEAAERQTKKDEKEKRVDDLNGSADGQTESTVEEDEEPDEKDDEEEAFDLNKIISGLATLSGPCGTYAVRESGGLAVLPLDPRKSKSDEEKKADEELFEPFPLVQGQTVQVVDFEDGVAKLARGAGYIVATSSQLVKVGGPQDSSCRLEGLLDTVNRRGEDLQRTLDENSQIAANLRKQVLDLARAPPTHPVISDPPRSEETERKDLNDSHPRTPTDSIDGGQDHIFRTPDCAVPQHDFMVVQHNDSTDSALEVDENGNAQCRGYSSPSSIDNSDLAPPGMPQYRPSSGDDDLQQLAFGCGSAFLGDSDLFSETAATGATLLSGLVLDPRPQPRRNSDSGSTGMQQYNYNAPVLTSSFSSSFDGVDFRTGMSGHRALQTTYVKSGAASPTPRIRVRMMSEHRGIGRVRGTLNYFQRTSPESSPAVRPSGSFGAPTKGEY